MKYRAAYKNDYRKWATMSVTEGRLTCAPSTPWEWQLYVTAEQCKELWKESYHETVRAIQEYSDLHVRRDDIILAPIGVLHPYHVCSAAAILSGSIGEISHLTHFGLYSEAPYNSSKWVAKIIDTHPCVSGLQGLQRFDLSGDGIGIDLKEKIFRDVYPTEVGIFRFTRNEVLDPQYRFYVPSIVADQIL